MTASGDVYIEQKTGNLPLFATAGEDNGGMMNKIDAFPRPFWLYYFNVDDIGAATVPPASVQAPTGAASLSARG